jgi:hypothetical protein
MFGKWNAAVKAYPDRPETWYGLGDSYFHWEHLAGTLFEGPYPTDPWHPNYDVAPDGRSFIMLRPVEEHRRLIMVVNWIEELRRNSHSGG